MKTIEQLIKEIEAKEIMSLTINFNYELIKNNKKTIPISETKRKIVINQEIKKQYEVEVEIDLNSEIKAVDKELNEALEKALKRINEKNEND